MDLISLLNNTANGLSAIQAKAATTSNNIANANTPGYARQQANLAEATPSALAGNRGYIGGGVFLVNVTQTRDQFVESQLPTAFSQSSGSTAQSDALASVSVFNNGVDGNLSDAMSAFYSSLTALAQNPGDTSLRQSSVQSAAWLVSSFNRTSVAVEQARSGIDASITSTVQQVNSTLAQVAQLNRRISVIEASGGQPNDLLDQRHNLMDQAAQLIGANQVPDAYGNISLVLPGGTTLVSSSVAATLTVQGNATNKGHTDLVFTPADGSAPFVLKQAELGGQIGGLLSARDGALGTASTDLDNLAFSFAKTINGQNQAGYDLNGNRGGDVFTVGAISANAAATITLDSALAGDPSLLAAAGATASGPGDATNLAAMVATQSAPLSNGLDVQKGMAKIVSDFGTAAADSQNAATFQKSMLQNLQDSRSSISGVSLDDEMVGLLQAQHAYQALAKVITTAGDMLDTLMQLK
ncbi:MAG TPA: flagellar hook-associated protein FlgK [Polyangia bacterium]|jgi:flagellar hook-associated protein FlgK|nr:flagellar hook-associated protein FlgK [Polyangia bacterium]